MKKRLLSFMTVLVLTFSVCMTAFATEGEITDEPVSRQGTAAELKSYGAIVYQKGTDSIRIDSDDLYMLADQIDQVKLDVNDQLAAMNTYFTAGEGIGLNTTENINVVHARPYEEDAVDPLEVNFDTLLEGIAVSQSVSSDVTAYGFPAGTELYKNGNGVLTTDGTEKGAEKISVTAATADNLSAGTAAWVNGSLILGTGEDNKSYSDSGYAKGKAEGKAEASSQIGQIDFIQYGGSLLAKVKDEWHMGPIDIQIPNKDVWLVLPGPISHKSRFTPAADTMVNDINLSFQLYKKDPDLPDTAMRTLHLPDNGNHSGNAAPWYLLYLK